MPNHGKAHPGTGTWKNSRWWTRILASVPLSVTLNSSKDTWTPCSNDAAS